MNSEQCWRDGKEERCDGCRVGHLGVHFEKNQKTRVFSKKLGFFLGFFKKLGFLGFFKKLNETDVICDQKSSFHEKNAIYTIFVIIHCLSAILFLKPGYKNLPIRRSNMINGNLQNLQDRPQ